MAIQLQVYISACILFVAGALFEYCSIITMLRAPINVENNLRGVLIKERQITKNRLSTARFIDMSSIVIFTMLFVVFNVIYFICVNIE